MRRRDRRIKYVVLGVFAAVVSLTFLLGRLRSNDVDAASLDNFDPGFIISDYTMSNYNSMTQAEIQSFLTRKNPCSNRDYDYYLSLTANNPGVYWHWEDGHFVCISEELFGEGMTIGEGKTAAQIIYETAQEYKINPQVLLVLIQKESSLITDPIPNNYDYRAMTGFGCPDTAPCDSKYYGFKNQIRKAAWLFREVLDGGWTNYPVGENYIQYNPNSGCGGSIVNVKNLATSALYRYTPYQPNAGAIAAGYGTAYCGAYGNRNFYLYFEDWFGGITDNKAKLEGKFINMSVPRVLYIRGDSRYLDPNSEEINIRRVHGFELFTHLNYVNGELCLSLGDGRNCYLYSGLEEISIGESEAMTKKRMLTIKSAAKYFNVGDMTFGKEISAGTRIIFDNKTQINGQACLQTSDDAKNGVCIFYDYLQELPAYKIKGMVVPRKMFIKDDAEIINLDTGLSEKISTNEEDYFVSSGHWFGELCLQRKKDEGTSRCILYKNLAEIQDAEFSSMSIPRFMSVKKGTRIINIANGQELGIVEDDTIAFFDNKAERDGDLCLQNTKVHTGSQCIYYKDLAEADNFSAMLVPREVRINEDAAYYDIAHGRYSEPVQAEKLYFKDKITVDGELCFRSNSDNEEHLYRCIKYSDLEE